jgi:hypothetical protein
MAVKPDTGSAGTSEGFVSRADFDALVDRNNELELMVQELAGNIEALTRAQMFAVGVDPAGAARRALGRTVVQFTANYNRLPQPSTVKDAPNVVEGYAVGALEVVRLRDDELARIQADFPGLVETNRDRFREYPKRVPYLERDQHGRPVWGLKTEMVKVATLIEKAPPVA